MLTVLAAVKDPMMLKPHLEGCQIDILEKDQSPEACLVKKGYPLVLLEGELNLITRLKSADPRVEVIFLGDREADALEAIKRGATAYFKLPLQGDLLQEAVRKIKEIVEVRRETGALERLLIEKYTFDGVTGRNPQMLEVFSLIRRIAPYYRTVLITGETGVGKEMIAKALHAGSPWAKHPFVVCNCGGFVENLIESELFGYLKGAFTGADRDKIGLFEAAGEGTLFLDEIGELPLSFQPHLLRVLQNGEFRRLGSHQSSQAKCRIIAATHRDLQAEVKERRFREDLFFRITPLMVRIPPLRDRKDDIPLLCRVVLDRIVKRTGKAVYGISRPAQAVLMTYDWPGNVRELENILEQAAILTTESYIRIEDLPAHIQVSRPTIPPMAALSLADVERRHIENILGQCGGNRSKASEVLGISRRALLRKIEKFDLK